VKAAFLHKFLNYVEWPPATFETSDAPYVIGIINADDVADELTRIAAAHKVNNRPVMVKRLGAADSLNGIHVLFIGKAEKARLPQLLKQSSQYVLDVTETEGALAQGSMINFRLVDNRVRFEVSLDAVDKAGLKLSARLLAVASAVIKGAQQ
jgi:hypothetical protein